MKFAIDTDVYFALNKGDVRVQNWVNSQHDIAIPIIVVGELRSGFAAGSQRQRNEQLLQSLLDAPNVEVLNLRLKTTELLAEAFAHLKKVGKPINTNDMWIAALCLDHKLSLLTLDKHFSAVPNLKLLKI